jgi:hypothetical protein
MSIPRCGTAPVSFLPQISGLPADFWASWPRRRIGTTLQPSGRHKHGPAVNAAVMKRLPESS